MTIAIDQKRTVLSQIISQNEDKILAEWMKENVRCNAQGRFDQECRSPYPVFGVPRLTRMRLLPRAPTSPCLRGTRFASCWRNFSARFGRFTRRRPSFFREAPSYANSRSVQKRRRCLGAKEIWSATTLLDAMGLYSIRGLSEVEENVRRQQENCLSCPPRS